MSLLGLAVAGALGAAGRFVVARRYNTELPIGTAAVNVGAAFGLAFLVARDAGGLLIQVGFLGALSTWSTFAVEVVELVRAGRRMTAAVYVIASCLAGVGAAWVGLQVG